MSQASQVTDVHELLEYGAQVVVVSRGMEFRLQTCPETLAFLRESNVSHHSEEANDVATLYNEIAERGERVAGLFHSTR